MKKKVYLGTQKVTKNGNALAVKLPNRWLTEHGLQIGDPLYSVLTIDEEIRVHLVQVNWSRKAKIRRAATRGSAYITLSTVHVRELGIEVGTKVSLVADTEHGILIVRRAA